MRTFAHEPDSLRPPNKPSPAVPQANRHDWPDQAHDYKGSGRPLSHPQTSNSLCSTEFAASHQPAEFASAAFSLSVVSIDSVSSPPRVDPERRETSA